MVTVRRAGPGDLAALMMMGRAYCEADGHEFDGARTRAAFQPLLEADTWGVVWIAERVSLQPVGYAVVTWSWSIESGGREALLDEVFAAEPGEGVGSALMERLIEDCRTRQLPRLFLETEAHNTEARRFYQRLGFGVEDSVWMVRDL